MTAWINVFWLFLSRREILPV
ncbi:MAG: hypothetical protein LBB40_00930 [Holophagales bacterium]|nr:hypothetical protein [Holophagales bacterium]